MGTTWCDIMDSTRKDAPAEALQLGLGSGPKFSMAEIVKGEKADAIYGHHNPRRGMYYLFTCFRECLEILEYSPSGIRRNVPPIGDDAKSINEYLSAWRPVGNELMSIFISFINFSVKNGAPIVWGEKKSNAHYMAIDSHVGNYVELFEQIRARTYIKFPHSDLIQERLNEIISQYGSLPLMALSFVASAPFTHAEQLECALGLRSSTEYIKWKSSRGTLPSDKIPLDNMKELTDRLLEMMRKEDAKGKICVPDESLRLSWHKDLYCLLKQYKDEHGRLPSNHDALKQIQQLVEKRKDETVFTKAELKSKTVAVRYMDHGEEKTIGRSAFDQMMTKLRKLF